jgi:probable O-glycosylation ligase (exosortase A-associated)
MTLSTVFSLNPIEAWPQWEKVIKIMGMTFVAFLLIRTREQVLGLIWVVALSLGFYGVKGGIFTVRGSGGDMVWGPAGTFIEDNNGLAMALLMTVPLLYFLISRVDGKWLKRGLVAATLLCAIAAIGTYSRGALIALVCMSIFLWFKSKRKILLAILAIVAAPAILFLMPQKWETRMDTIQTYEEDESVKGRFIAWQTAFNVAKDRPLIGTAFILRPWASTDLSACSCSCSCCCSVGLRPEA